VVSRVANLPLVSSACDLVSMAYTSTKESHPHIRSLCDVAAKGVKTMTEATINCAQPVLTKLEPQIAAANEFACKGLDKLEEKLPILQQPTDKVTSSLRAMVLLDAKELVTGTRDAMNSRVTEVLDKTMQAAKSAVTSGMSTVMGSRVGPVSGAEAMQGKSVDLVDHSLPITDDELAKLAASVKGFEVASVEQQQKYFVRLGSLATELCQRTYLQSVSKVRLLHQIQFENSLFLSPLQTETVKQSVGKKLHKGQQKLHQLWLEWTKKELAVIDNGSAQPEVDTLVLVMSWRITQQLQTICLNLVILVQGLPTSVQDKMQQAHHNLQEVHAAFSKANSFQDLSTSILTCSKKKLLKAQEYVDELFEYVVHKAHLSWLVGPFT
ncbi:Perilipin-3, partial [Chelonia mydas]